MLQIFNHQNNDANNYAGNSPVLSAWPSLLDAKVHAQGTIRAGLLDGFEEFWRVFSMFWRILSNFDGKCPKT